MALQGIYYPLPLLRKFSDQLLADLTGNAFSCPPIMALKLTMLLVMALGESNARSRQVVPQTIPTTHPDKGDSDSESLYFEPLRKRFQAKRRDGRSNFVVALERLGF